MKKYALMLVIFFITSSLWAQKKFALVIGNGAYTNIARLKNPVNDANDMADTLRTLDFDVQTVLNGNLEKMEKAVNDFSQRLSTSRNSYGFFFYAGHGVQLNGENYLIPVGNASIDSESQLRDRAVSLGFVLENLEKAGNELNLIVLDACRDNPFSFSRGGIRGLSGVSHSPPGSITMYATSAGSVAQDGDGRNGTFTSCLLNNLKLSLSSPMDVDDVFKRTMGDVAKATGNKQLPAYYSQFSGKAYLGSRPPENKLSYLIGETGPAGGLIFYDKGKPSDGWQYLEVAPVSKEFRDKKWGANGIDVPDTRTDIGSGRKNTELIIKCLKENNENGMAAQLCALLSYGGYNDWFLPSLDELNLIYENLWKDKKQGDFKQARYWSSSQHEKYDAWYFVFNDTLLGSAGRPSFNYAKNNKLTVRAIRAF